MASVRLSSRFEILNVMDASPDFDDSDGEQDDGNWKPVTRKANKDVKSTAGPNNANGLSTNAKKRMKKKKNKQQQQQQTAELRDIAFNKIPSIPKGLVGSPPHSVINLPPGLSAEPLSTPPANSLQHLVGNPMQWEDWKRKDKGYVHDQFQEDLQKAILASKTEYEQQQQFVEEVGEAYDDDAPPGMNRKERRKHMQGKDKPHPMSLQDFQSTPTSSSNGGGIDVIEAPKKPEPDPTFFDRVDKDVAEILSKEDRMNMRKQNQKLAAENARRVQHEDDLDKKDHELTEMKTSMDKMKEELAQVKKRNKQLCFILAQGEMKDKADVLKQVDELTAVKDELTAEVAELYAALEQERSKVSTLKSELQRLHDRKK